MSKLRIDLARLLRNAAEQIREPTATYAAALACELGHAAQAVERVRRGEMSLYEFCDLYDLPARGYPPDEPQAPYIPGPEAEEFDG